MAFLEIKRARRDLVTAHRLRRRSAHRTRFRFDTIGHASTSVQIGRRAFWIDYRGDIHRDWSGDRRLAALQAGAGGQ